MCVLLQDSGVTLIEGVGKGGVRGECLARVGELGSQGEGAELVEDGLLLGLAKEEKLGVAVHEVSIVKIGVGFEAVGWERLLLAGLLFCVLGEATPVEEVLPEVIDGVALVEFVKHLTDGVAAGKMQGCRTGIARQALRGIELVDEPRDENGLCGVMYVNGVEVHDVVRNLRVFDETAISEVCTDNVATGTAQQAHERGICSHIMETWA